MSTVDPHTRYGPRRAVGRIVFGLIILALGVLFTLDNLNVIDSDDYLRFWPVILIALGLGKLLAPREGGKGFGAVLVLFGALFLLRNLGRLTWDVWDLWPLLLVLLGGSIVFDTLTGRPHRRRRPHVQVTYGVRGHGAAGLSGSSAGGRAGDPDATIDPDSTVEVSAILGGSSRICTSKDFRGGRATAIMGGSEIDLRQASIAPGGQAVIDVFALLGGIEIRVPDDWKVIVNANAILGGVEDKTRAPVEDGKRLIVSGQVMLGGLDIHN